MRVFWKLRESKHEAVFLRFLKLYILCFDRRSFFRATSFNCNISKTLRTRIHSPSCCSITFTTTKLGHCTCFTVPLYSLSQHSASVPLFLCVYKTTFGYCSIVPAHLLSQHSATIPLSYCFTAFTTITLGHCSAVPLFSPQRLPLSNLAPVPLTVHHNTRVLFHCSTTLFFNRYYSDWLFALFRSVVIDWSNCFGFTTLSWKLLCR